MNLLISISVHIEVENRYIKLVLRSLLRLRPAQHWVKAIFDSIFEYLLVLRGYSLFDENVFKVFIFCVGQQPGGGDAGALPQSEGHRGLGPQGCQVRVVETFLSVQTYSPQVRPDPGHQAKLQ